VECYEVTRRELQRELASGELDLAIDIPLYSVPQLCRQTYSSDPYVCVLRPDHPAADKTLSLDAYLALDHLHVSSRRRGVGHVDMALEQLGRQRRVTLRMRSYLAAPQVIRSTDLALTIPHSLAALHDLAIRELPFDVEPLEQILYWHRNADQDRGNRWLRSLLLDLPGG
jgi:DNA-binding transcriptional LysR family regulator